MKARALTLLALLAAPELVVPDSRAEPPLAYRFEEVKSKVLRFPGGDEKQQVRAAAGDSAAAGDVVKTGFWARTVLSVPDRACRFEVSSATRVRLAGGEPGVVLVLESGRLKAIFDAFTGASEKRRVAAPGALLAVRGTRYGLEVGAEGQTVLAVFEGTVEVFPTAPGAASVRVGRDEYCLFGPRTPPRKAPMGPTGMSEKSWGARAAEGQPGGRPGGPQGQGGSQMPGGPQGSPQGSPPGGMPRGGGPAPGGHGRP